MKRIISLLLLSALLLLNIPFVSAEDAAAESMPPKTYQQAADFLALLDIMELNEEGETHPDEKMTRAEFSLVLSKVMGFGDVLGNNYVGKFLDVDNSHPAFSAIEFMSDIGIVNGFENQYFYPNEPVLFGHALKMVVVGLGYNQKAELRGGYPAGYFAVAKDLDLLEDIDLTAADPLVNAMAAQLIYNSLFVDIAKVNGVGDYLNYEVQEGVTFLSENFDIIECKGQMTGAAGSTLIGEAIPKGMVKIDNQLYETEGVDAEQYLGYYVKCFVVEDESGVTGGTIVQIAPDAKKNDVLTIASEHIFADTNKNTVVYEDMENDGEIERVSIANAFVVFNGGLTFDCTDADFRPVCGELVLIDTNRDEVYDVVHITSYDVCIVDGVSTSVVTFKYGKERLELDADNSSSWNFYQDGKEISASDLTEWDICSVKRSKDGKRNEVYVANKKITGLVSEISETQLKIGDAAYTLSQSYFDYQADTSQHIPAAEVGKEAVLCFDVFDEIVAIKSSGTKNYGYLINASQKLGLKNETYYRILTTENGGEIKNFTGAKNVLLNGEKLENMKDEPAIFDADTQKIISQIVVYRLNADGEIMELETAVDKFNETVNENPNPDYVSGYIGYTEDEFTLDYAFTGKVAYRDGSMKSFEARKTRVANNCKVFIIPNIEDPRDDEYMVQTATYFKNDTYYSNLSFYDVTPDFEAQAIVSLVGSGGSSVNDTIDNKTTLAVLDQVTMSLNSDGDVMPTFKGWRSGKYVSLVCAKDDIRHKSTVYGAQYYGKMLKDLPRGSVVQYKTNAREEITEIRILFIPEEDTFFFESRGSSRVGQNDIIGQLYIAYGKVIQRTKNGIIYNAHSDNTNIELDGTDSAWDRHISIGANVTLYDSEKDEIKYVSSLELREGDRIFLQMCYADRYGLVVYR